MNENIKCPMCSHVFEKKVEESDAEKICGAERPPRDVLCQLKKHTGRHCAVIFWE